MPWAKDWRLEWSSEHTNHGNIENVTVTLRAIHHDLIGLVPPDRAARMYRKWSVEWSVDLTVYKYKKVEFVDQLTSVVDYLFAMVLPAPKPKAYRILQQRLVLSPAPKRRSRLRIR